MLTVTLARRYDVGIFLQAPNKPMFPIENYLSHFVNSHIKTMRKNVLTSLPDAYSIFVETNVQ